LENITENKIRVYLADDHQMVLDALDKMLSSEKDIQVIGTERDGLRAVASVLNLKPDVMVMDVSMPGNIGFEAIQGIRKHLNSQRILVLTVSEQIEDINQALQYGARGYILKRDSIRSIVIAIRRIASGDLVISHRLIIRLIAEFRSLAAEWGNFPEVDQQILRLYEEGVSLPSICERLGIDENRVNSCLQLFLGMLRFRLQNRLKAKVETEQTTRRTG
jgi:DNA-binding NarL/FixJ family response regulator